LTVQSLPLHQFAEKTVDVAVIDLVDRFLRERRGQEHRGGHRRFGESVLKSCEAGMNHRFTYIDAGDCGTWRLTIEM
jgi:hypothetical protein